MEFIVKTNDKTSGSEFKYWDEDNKTKKIKKGKIIIGTKLLSINPVAVLAGIIHELKEIIHEEQAVRFQRPDNTSEYEFHYNHQQHTDFCSRLAGFLSKFIK